MSIVCFELERPLSYPPRITTFTRRFWDGLRQGQFQTTLCTGCQHVSFPPKPICPQCWQETVDWIDLPVTGRLYAWTRIHAGPAVFSAELPYDVGVVDLDNGVRLACRLRTRDGDSATTWTCDKAVRLMAGLADNGVMLVAVPD